ncbi:C39 family peptidase [Natronospora cellulosivora (SeqCode)]
MNIFKYCIKAILFLLVLIVSIIGVRYMLISHRIRNDIVEVYKYEYVLETLIIEGTPTIRQEISCGYASIEWLTSFLGNTVSEEELYQIYEGGIVTSTSRGFEKELSKRLADSYSVRRISNVPDSEIIREIHNSLNNGLPVPFSFAAIDDWNRPNYTLHFSIVTGLDIENDQVLVSNVYGYEEVYSLNDFLESLKFKNFRNMPFFIRGGIILGIFERNTVYIIEEVS